MMPESANQMPAPMENDCADGFSPPPPPGSRVAAPMPMPSMLRTSWVTSATTTPASTAPQEILLISMVRASSAGVTGLMWGASSSPRLRGVSG
jgi:hypothetical protein